MRNCVRIATPLALAMVLALGGAAFAGDNASAVFTIDPTELSDVGPGSQVQLSLSGSGLVGVKQVNILIEVSPVDAFDLSSSTFAPQSPLFSIGAGVQFPAGTDNQVQGAGADFGSGLSGDSPLGTFTLTTSDSFSPDTEATVTVILISVGPSSNNRDEFSTGDLGLSLQVNPPAPAPSISGIDPSSASVAGGVQVSVSGADFQDGATLSIGGNAATGVSVVDASTITATVPAGAAGAADVVVSNPDGQSATLSGGFTYIAIPAPSISGIDPSSASVVGGVQVSVSGADFQDGATLSIGGNAATGVSVVDASTITATVPAGAEGAADVVVSNPDGQSATLSGGFTYIGIIEPRLTLNTPSDLSLDFSPLGSGGAADGSAGEHTPYVKFTDATGAAAAGQEITWSITNNGAETVFVINQADGSVVEISAGETVTTTATTNDKGTAALVGQAPAGSGTSLFDAEGDKASGSTSLSAVASTTADNSEGVSRDLSVELSVTWDVAVAAELATFAGEVVADDEVLLQWGVASQSNNLGWEVFRSVDNVLFERVGDLIAGDGTTDEFKTFSFTDTRLPEVDVLYYYLKQIDLDGTTSRSNTIQVLVAPTAVEARVLPTSMALLQNYPNPFNPETTLRFELSKDAVVTLTIYDALGQEVRTLVNSQAIPAGQYERIWDGFDNRGTQVGSGVYFYRLKAGDFTGIKKMTLLR